MEVRRNAAILGQAGMHQMPRRFYPAARFHFESLRHTNETPLKDGTVKRNLSTSYISGDSQGSGVFQWRGERGSSLNSLL
jgi:hypothetical protein